MCWAPLLFALLFDDYDPFWWQIHDLAAFHFSQVPLAMLAALDRMHNHQIGRRRELSGMVYSSNGLARGYVNC
jgi:hypothetical protein